MAKLEKNFVYITGIISVLGIFIEKIKTEEYKNLTWIGLGGSLTIAWTSYFLGRASVGKKHAELLIDLKNNHDSKIKELTEALQAVREHTAIANDEIVKSFSDVLLEYFENLEKDGKDAEIIYWGLALSKPLWNSQKYEIRKRIGEFVENAAINRDNHMATIKVWIDEIGWSAVEMLDYSTGNTKFHQALELAVKKGKPALGLLAKCYRHLNASHFRQHEIVKAEEFLNLSFMTTLLMDEGDEKNELLAEYYFAKSTLELKKDPVEALKLIEMAEKQYGQQIDDEWRLKIQARKAEILIALHQPDDALVISKKGLADSKHLQLHRLEVKHQIGMGLCYLAMMKKPAAEKELTHAQELAEKMDMFYEIELIRQYFIQMNKKD